MTSESQLREIAALDAQIAELKEERDRLIRNSSLKTKEIQRILKFRTPRRTIRQLLRELHDVSSDEQRDKVEDCLLIAKKMDEKLRECAGARYTDSWYDEKGEFVG